MTTNIDAIRQRPSYADVVAAIRTEFPPMALEALWIQMREHRYNTSSLGVLAQAVHDAHDPAYEVPDLRAQVADLADKLHKANAEIASLTKAGTVWANENQRLRDRLFADKPVIDAAEAWAELRDEEGITLADSRKADAALYDAVESYRVMDMALDAARAEAEVAR